jgi:hypothetical protein
MTQEPKLVESLSTIYNTSLLNDSNISDEGNTSSSDSLLVFTRDTLTTLYPHMSEKQKQQLPTLQQQMDSQRKKKLRKKHNITLNVKELTNEKSRSTLESVILNTLRDTISYTFSVPDHRAHIYTRTSTERILQTLSNAGFTCTVLLDSVCETEYNTSANEATHDKENYKPKYVERRTESSESKSRSLVAANDSIEARLERKKRKQEKLDKEKQQNTGNSFIGKIASIFW